jgi:hypothetical protein
LIATLASSFIARSVVVKLPVRRAAVARAGATIEAGLTSVNCGAGAACALVDAAD